MVGPNKILTVSYGTFSCTLEGFDDPFSTMRGIAEYFRDLAADDRYFGAEPPTPDAEMLHRIAEREIQRRVEARVSDTGIVLRQTDDHPAVQPRKEGDEELEAAEHVAAQPVEDEPKSENGEWFTPAPAVAAAGIATSTVAERLARIRAVVAQTEGEEADEEDDNIYPRDLTEAVIGDDEDADAPEDLVEPEMAVEAEAEVEIAEPVEETEDEFDMTAVLAMDGVEADEVAHEAEVEADEVAHEAEVEADEDALVALELADVATDEAPVADEQEPESAEAFEDEFEEVSDDQIDLSAIMVSDADRLGEMPDVADLDEELDEPAFEASDFAALVAAEEVAEAAEAGTTEEPEEDTETVTRLLRMRRADFEASAEATSYIDEIAGAEFVAEPDVIEVEPQDEEGALSVEDEAELMAELASAEAQEVDEAVEAEHEVTARAPVEEATAEPTVRRLLDVTNSEMEQADGTRRRSAIAHLKAAVAATRADRQAAQDEGELDPTQDDTDDTEAYREDLARVVRPRRMGNVARAISRRLPPLMLVSEQRVDAEEKPVSFGQDEAAAEGGAIRPRRINARDMDEEDDDDADDNIFSEAGSFAEFAREMGAADLPELLEAAAAYYHYVEGQPYFSRPQIMSAVASMDDSGEFSREDSLKSFGMLLRRGKIRKVRRGQFEIDDSTRFRPQLQAGE